jgi:hypothetical protein
MGPAHQVQRRGCATPQDHVVSVTRDQQLALRIFARSASEGAVLFHLQSEEGDVLLSTTTPPWSIRWIVMPSSVEPRPANWSTSPGSGWLLTAAASVVRREVVVLRKDEQAALGGERHSFDV